MASRLPKSSRVALSLTVAVTAMALCGSAYAQFGTANTRTEAPSTGGSLRDAPDQDAADPLAADDTAAEPAADEAPAASAPSDGEPPAEADEDAATDETEPE